MTQRAYSIRERVAQGGLSASQRARLRTEIKDARRSDELSFSEARALLNKLEGNYGIRRERERAQKIASKVVEKQRTPQPVKESLTPGQIARQANIEKGFVSIDPRIKTKDEIKSNITKQIFIRKALPITSIQARNIPYTSKLQFISGQKFTGSVSKVEKQKGLKAIPDIFREKREKLEYEATIKTSNPLKRQIKSYAALGLGIAEGFTYPIFRPVETVKGTIQAGLHPTEAIKQMGQELQINPGGTIGTVVGGYALGKVTSYAAGKIFEPKTEFTVQESGTKRIATNTRVIDKTYLDITAKKGRQTFSLKGKALQEFTLLEEGRYGLKAQAELKKSMSSKITAVDTRGIAIKKQGGFDVVSASKIKSGRKNQLYIDVTQTVDIATNEKQRFASLSRTAEVPKGKTINQAVPRRISAGITEELYIEDIFKPTKNIFKKNVLTESGDLVSIEYILEGKTSGLDPKTFTKKLLPAKRKLSKAQISRLTTSVDQSSSYQSLTKVNQKYKLTSLSASQQNALVNIGKDLLKRSIKKQSISKPSYASALTIRTKTSTPTKSKKVTKQTSQYVLQPDIKSKERFLSSKQYDTGIKSRILPGYRPLSSNKVNIDSGTKPILNLNSIQNAKNLQQTLPRFKTQTITELDSAYQQINFTPTPPTPPPPPPLSVSFDLPSPVKPQFKFFDKKSKKKKGKTTRQYTPSVEAVALNIKGPRLKLQAETGAGLRPL